MSIVSHKYTPGPEYQQTGLWTYMTVHNPVFFVYDDPDPPEQAFFPQFSGPGRVRKQVGATDTSFLTRIQWPREDQKASGGQPKQAFNPNSVVPEGYEGKWGQPKQALNPQFSGP